MKEKVLKIRISNNQLDILEAKARSAGFRRKSDYVRYVLFMPMNVHDMIKEIYDKIVK